MSTKASANTVKPTSEIPGDAKSDNVLGNLGDVGKCGSLHEYLYQRHKKYGSVFSFWWGDKYVVSLSGEASYSAKKLSNRPSLMFEFGRRLIGDWSLQYANYADFDERNAAYIRPAFDMSFIQKVYWKNFNIIVSNLVNSLSTKGSEPVSAHSLSMELAISSARLNFFNLTSESPLEKELVTKLFNSYTTSFDMLEKQLGGYIPGKEEQELLERELAFFKQTILDIITLRKKIYNPELRECFLDFLLAYANSKTNLPPQFLIDESVTTFVGGFHTSGNLLTWLIYFLGSNPDVQEKIRKEIETMDINTEPVRKFKYIEAVIKETLRLSILAPFAARFSDAEEIIGEGENKYILPAGTPIVLALGVSCIDDRWTDPERFNPSRFLDGHADSKIRFSPFGFAGGRVCPGYSYTYHFATLLVYHIIKNLNVNCQQTQMDIPQRSYGLVTKPDREIFVKFSKLK